MFRRRLARLTGSGAAPVMAPRALGSTTGPPWKYGPERTWQEPLAAGSPWLGQPGGTGLLRLLWPAGNGLGGPVARGPGPATERCLRRITRAAGGGGTQIGPAGPSGHPSVPLFRTRQAEIPAVPGGHGGRPDPGGRETRTIRPGRRRFSNCCTTRTEATLSVFDFLRVRFGQVLTPVLLAPTALLKYISPKRLSGQISSHCCLGGSENEPRLL